MSRKVFRYKFKKSSADVCLHVVAKRRVVPDDVSLAVSSRASSLSVFIVG